jgi:hypothetical protein
VNHGFVRVRNGRITTFDVPCAGTASFQGTVAQAINPAGVTVGSYLDSNFTSHAFVRAADSTITTFDAPEAGTATGQGTIALHRVRASISIRNLTSTAL